LCVDAIDPSAGTVPERQFARVAHERLQLSGRALPDLGRERLEQLARDVDHRGNRGDELRGDLVANGLGEPADSRINLAEGG
jgi:hypothetical protein